MLVNRVVKILEKDSVSKTSGSSSLTTRSNGGLFGGTTSTATNNIRTDHIQKVVMEDINNETVVTYDFINQNFETPVNRNTAISLLKGKPMAYIPSKKAEVRPLTYLTLREKPSKIAMYILFLICCVPILNFIILASHIFKNIEYYENGSIKTYTQFRVACLLGCIAALSYFVIGYYGMFVLGILASGYCFYSYYEGLSLEYKGKEALWAECKAGLEPLRDQI